jgi:membrane-bound serine protease (ClpP class)
MRKPSGLKLIYLVMTASLFFVIAFASGDTGPDEGKKVYFIPVHGEINRSLTIFVRRSIEKAEAGGGGYIVFDVDTFGGRVDSALQITTLIGSVDSAQTIAYVTTSPESTGVSWSAGALISFSCGRIYMSPGTSMGAAAPITMGPEGQQAASEKVVSAVRAQMAALAEKNGYPKDIARAMVDQDIELKEVFVDGKLRAADTEEISDIEREAKKQGQVVEIGKVISASGKLLTLTAMEMEKYGVSSGTISNRQDLLDKIGVSSDNMVILEESATDRVAGAMTGPAVTGILIMIGLVALFIEITSPGFGVPGTIAIICFAVVFSSYALLGTVGSLELILFVLGLVLLILEIFVIPGFGVAGISGIALIVASLVLSMQGFVIPSFEWQKNIFRRNLFVVGAGVVSSIAAFSVLAYSLPKLRLFSHLTLETSQTADAGYTVQSPDESSLLVGKIGTAVTTLRPSGKAMFDDELMYVETEGEFAEAGVKVEIIEVSGNRIVVRKC